MILLLVASELEFQRLKDVHADVITSRVGVGKVAAAIGATRAILEYRPQGILIGGISGALGVDPGSLMLVTRDCLLDDGMQGPDGWHSLESLELGANAVVSSLDACVTQADFPDGWMHADGYTLSSGTGTRQQALERYAQRPQPLSESLELAAIAMSAEHFSLPWLGVRGISNLIGPRIAGSWQIDPALDACRAAVPWCVRSFFDT